MADVSLIFNSFHFFSELHILQIFGFLSIALYSDQVYY